MADFQGSLQFYGYLYLYLIVKYTKESAKMIWFSASNILASVYAIYTSCLGKRGDYLYIHSLLKIRFIFQNNCRKKWCIFSDPFELTIIYYSFAIKTPFPVKYIYYRGFYRFYFN